MTLSMGNQNARFLHDVDFHGTRTITLSSLCIRRRHPGCRLALHVERSNESNFVVIKAKFKSIFLLHNFLARYRKLA